MTKFIKLMLTSEVGSKRHWLNKLLFRHVKALKENRRLWGLAVTSAKRRGSSHDAHYSMTMHPDFAWELVNKAGNLTKNVSPMHKSVNLVSILAQVQFFSGVAVTVEKWQPFDVKLYFDYQLLI